MVQLIKFNANHYVRVRLTKEGVRVLRAAFGPEGARQHIEHHGTPDGSVRFHLWELAQIFGEHLYNGNPTPPFHMDLVLEQP